MTRPTFPNSPGWSDSSKRLVLIIIFILATLLLYRVRSLLLPLIMAVVLAYLVEPVVKALTRWLRLPRILSIVLIYLLILAGLVSIPVSAIPPIVNQTNNFINNLPSYLQQVGTFLQQPVFVAGVEIPIHELPLDQVYAGLSSNLITIIQGIGGSSLGLLGSIAGATISTVGWTILVLFLSFYLVKDHDLLFQTVVGVVPVSHQGDIYLLSEQISVTWNAFLRGQLVLSLVMASLIFAVALILDLPNALLLALVAGVAEFLPTVGPVLAAIPAVLVALFQSQASWVGGVLSPFWFAVTVMGIYGVMFQLENYYLVPRIMGHHLRLHPLVVIIGALGGASVAGLLGILLAAPVLATFRLFLMYIYYKLTDRPPFPRLVVGGIELETAGDDAEAETVEPVADAPLPESSD